MSRIRQPRHLQKSNGFESLVQSVRFVLPLILVFLVLAPPPANSHICWNYAENQPADVFTACSGVVPTNILEQHGTWHCNFPSASNSVWGNAFIGFHRQFILDFDIFRLKLGIDRLRVWDSQPNDPVPGNFEDFTGPFTHCFSWDAMAGDCVDDDTSRPGGALCTGCIGLPSDLVGPANLGSYATMGAVGARLSSSNWHGNFHCSAAAAGGGSCSTNNPCDNYVANSCDDVGNSWETTHDPAFWMGHKKLDEVARDWQQLKAADIVIVLDRSTSMDDNCPGGNANPGETPCKLNDAKEAATLFVDLIQDDRPGSSEEHRIGLVSFGSTATKHLGGVLIPAAGAVTEGGGADTPFEMALAGIGVAGATSIGDGIRKALEVLATGSNPHKAILILSDGAENASPLIQDIRDTDELGTVQVCAIGFGGTFSDPDDKLRMLAEDFGGVFIADPNNTDSPITLEKFFVDCFGQIYDEVINEDPIALLPAGEVATFPIKTQVCGSDDRLTIVLGRDRSLGASCDLSLVVTTPAGNHVDLSDPLVERGHNSSWDFVRIPLPYRGEGSGVWTAWGVRPQRVFVHGFATDTYANPDDGVDLVRREIHRLSPTALSSVLYYEDGSLTGASAYSQALLMEMEAGNIALLKEASSADEFTGLLTSQSWELIVFARQTNLQLQSFDQPLANLLCEGQKALITDLYTPALAPNLVLQCVGTVPRGEVNWTSVVGDGRLVDGVIPLSNPGYNLFSISLFPAAGQEPWAILARNEFQEGSIIGNGSLCDDQEFFYDTLTRGFGRVRAANLQPRVGIGDRILASFRMTESNRPVGGWDAVQASLTLQRPGGAMENHLLYDDGTNGDKMPNDDYWEVEIPNVAQASGSYLLKGEFFLTKDGCTVRRETEYSITAQSDPQDCVRTICPKPRPARAGEAVGILFCARNLCRADDEVQVTVTDSKGWLSLRHPDGSLTSVPSLILQELLMGHQEGHCFLQLGEDDIVIAVPAGTPIGESTDVDIEIVQLSNLGKAIDSCNSSVFVQGAAVATDPVVPSTPFSEQARSRAGSSMVDFALTIPETGSTRLEVYDVRGRRVATILSRELSAGPHSVAWTGKDDDGAQLASGVYFYRAASGSHVATGSVVLLR